MYYLFRFAAALFTDAMRAISDEVFRLEHLVSVGRGADRVIAAGDLLALLTDAIRRFGLASEGLSLTTTTRGSADRLGSRLGSADPWLTVAEAKTLFEELYNQAVQDLGAIVFLTLDLHRNSFYELQEPPFGQAVADKFPDAAYDIDHASRCIALEEWTAAVLHLMRAHELALRALGKKLKIKVAKNKTIDYQDWQVIIDGVHAAVKAAPRGSAKGTRAALAREFYSEVASHLFHIKEVWRVPFMHARARSDERQAMIIWENTRALMQLLAGKMP